MILSGLFWIIACIVYIIYEGRKEDKVLTKNILKGIAIISAVIIIPCTIVYVAFGEKAAQLTSILVFVIPGLCLVVYGIGSSMSAEHQVRQFKEAEQASPEDRRRQVELECTPIGELCNKLGLIYEDICEGQSRANIISLAVSEIMRRENRKYTGYDMRYSEYAKRFNGFLNGTLETMSQRIASLELLYITNILKFEEIAGHKINNVESPLCYNETAIEILKNIAIYDILTREGYYFTKDQTNYMTDYKCAIERIKSLSTMKRSEFERECGSEISDSQAINRYDLIILLLKKGGWLDKLRLRTILPNRSFCLSEMTVRDLIPYNPSSIETNPSIAQLLK